MAAGTVSATFDAGQRAGDQDRPGSRGCLGGRVLTSAGYDNSVRWREGDRLEWLFERRCDWLRRQGRSRHLAVDAMDGTLSYLGLDARANQLARFLVRQGVLPGDRIGLLSDRAVDGYLGMLAVLKARATYVPLDPGYPPDRLAYIAAALAALAQSVPGTPIEPRGRGLARCLAFEDGELAGKVSAAAFERGLLVETAGPRGEAVRLLPPLTITDAELDQGLELLADAVRSVC